jgi:hypothetical protein
MKNSMRILPVFLTLALAGCTPSAHQPLADAGYANNVKIEKMAKNKSRVLVFLGDKHSNLLIPLKNNSPSEFYINSVNVGVIYSGECLAVDLKPGIYKFSMKEKGTTATSGEKPYTLHSGQSVYLGLDWNQNWGKSLSGTLLTGGLLIVTVHNVELVDHSAEAGQIISDMKIVLPNADTISKIQPLASGDAH